MSRFRSNMDHFTAIDVKFVDRQTMKGKARSTSTLIMPLQEEINEKLKHEHQSSLQSYPEYIMKLSKKNVGSPADLKND
jgi:hypothetical protein